MRNNLSDKPQQSVKNGACSMLSEYGFMVKLTCCPGFVDSRIINVPSVVSDFISLAKPHHQ